MKKFLLVLLAIFCISFSTNAQDVTFLDSNFKTALLNHTPSIDINGDLEIQTDEAIAFNGILDVSQSNISNLAGIEAFINITELLCNNNALTTLNTSSNTSLLKINCGANNLSELIISQNTNLIELICGGNNLNTVDTSLNTNLEVLNVNANGISSLNLSTNVALKNLSLNFNSITALDISNNSNLEVFSATYCYSLGNINFANNTLLEQLSLWHTNQYTIDVSSMENLRLLYLRNLNLNTLNVSNNPNLFNLYVTNNSISEIDVSNNSLLAYLSVNEFSINTIDVSNNTSLVWLDVSGNQLQSINAKNGTNSIFTNFQIDNTPNLQSICVDSIDYATLNFNIPTTSYFTEICSADDCDAFAIGYNESFETLTQPNINPCWRKVPETYASNYYVQSTSNSNTGSNGVALRSNSSSDAFLITPELTDFNASKRISFWMLSSAQTTLSIGTLSDPNDSSTYTLYSEIDSNDSNGYQWREYKIDFSEYTGSDVYVGFKLTSNALVYLDDFQYLESPSCIEPSNLTALAFSSDALLDWSNNANATSWDIEYGEEGFTQGNGTIINTTTKPFSLTGLNPDTDYSFYVSANCGESDQSGWSSASNFTTICQALSAEYNYGFDDSYPSEFDTCWKEQGNSFVASSGGNTPQSLGYLRMYSFSSTSAIVVTPELEALDNSKRIKLWINNFDGDSGVTIGTIQNPNDFSTFTPFQSFTSSELPANEWKKIIINFDSYSGTDRFIGIRQDTSVFGADIYIDDFTYQLIPTCLEPANLEVTTLTATEISVQWLEQATANNWEIEYGVSGFTQGTGTVINASAENITITDLTPDTQYDIYVKSICSASDASEWITIYNVNTGCGPVEANYSQDFDASLEMANCWLTIPEIPTGNTNAHEVTVSNQNKVGNSGYSARFVDYDLDTNVFLISPEFSDLASGNTRVKFWLNTQFSDSNIIVGTISDPSDESTFTPLETILSTDMVFREWKQFSVNLDGYTGTDTRVAFKMELTGDASNIFDFIYFDAFEYTTIPTCQSPTTLENSGISNGELTLTWQENNTATQWEIEYGEAGFWQGEGTVIQTNSNPYIMQGLALETNYDFYVRAICDSQNVSDWSTKLPVNFGCGQSYQVNYTHDFNTSTLDDCWKAIEAPSQSGSTSFSIVNNNNGTASGYSAYLRDATQFSSTAIYMSSPILTDLSLDKKVEFYISNYSGGLTVGTITNPNDYTTFTALTEIEGNVNNSTWEKRVVYLNNYNGTDSHIAFRQKKASSSDGNQVYIDDFAYLQSVICNTPTNFEISNILDNSVDLSWIGSGVEAEWEIEYEEVGTYNAEVLVQVSSETYTINNLIEGTEYTVRLRAKCEATLFSEWTDLITFNTGCEVKSAGYFESFEFENELSPCWSKVVSGQTSVIYPIENYTVGGSYNYEVLPVTGNQFLNFRNSQDITERYLISRPLANVDNTKRVRFSLISRAYSSSSSYNSTTLEIGTMSDPTDVSTFTLVATIQPEDMNEFKTNGLETVSWKEHTIYFDNYSGTDSYIVIKAGNEDIRSEFMLDDFYFEDIPTCTEPLYPEVIDERYDAVDVAWETYQNASLGSWEVEYGPTDFVLGTGTTITASSNNFTIPNLVDDTAYDFYVRANCGSEFSAWSVKQTFKTKCIGVNVGYFENFDAQADGFISGCWTGLRPAPTGSPYWDENTNTNTVPTISDNYSSIAHSAPNVVRLFNEVYHPNANASEEIILVSPRLIGFDNYKVVSFWLNPDSSLYASPTEIIVGTLSDPDDASTFTPYYTITNASQNEDTWTKYEIDFSNYYLTHEYVGIRQAAVNERQLVLIDDFEYSESGCVTPTNLAAEQTNSQEVTFSWQDNNTAQAPNGWEIEYGQTGFTQGSGTTVTATSNPFTIQNISAFTTYDYYVRANCNAIDGFSNWSVAYTFNVSCAFTAPFYEDFDQNQATNGSNASIPNFCWTRSSNLYFSGIANISSFDASFGSSPNSGFVSFGSTYGNDPEPLPGYITSPFLMDFDNTKMIKFSLRNESQGVQPNYNLSGIIVGTMSNPIDRSTFTPFTTIEASEIAVFGKEFVVDFSNYTGTDKYITFMHDTTNNAAVYIDNVTYKNIPTCIEPIHVKREGFSDTSVTLSWENLNSSGNYEIEYGTSGFTQGTGTIINTSSTLHQISGLAQSTNYQFYVRSTCVSENSIWIGPINVTTACNTEGLPWQENFNNMSNYGSNQLPDCFYGENEWVSSDTNISSYQVGENDSHYIYFTYDTIGEYPSLITPMFNLEAGTTYNFSFKMRKEAGDYSFQSVRVKTGLGNTHESMTNFLNYFADFDFGFYEFYPIETTFTPVVSGAYSFGLYFTFSSPVHTLTLDSFSLESGYDGLLDPETAPEVFDFESGLPSSFVLEETEETICEVVTEPGTNKTGNQAISMKLRSTLANWVETSNNNQKWISNQNGINKVNFEIDATNESSLFMSFDLKQFYANNPNESIFRVIANGNVILDNIYATTNTDYTNYEVDLSGLVGSNIRISLQQLGRNLGTGSNPSDEVYLDNIQFSNGSTLSLEDFNFNGLTYFPNPINDVFHVNNNKNIDTIEVYNILGQNVYKDTVNATRSSINFEALPAAVYFIKITIDNTERTLKVIKK